MSTSREQLPVFTETTNDRRIVAVYKDSSVVESMSTETSGS